jgi:regulatory protein
MPKRSPIDTLEEAYDEAVRMLARKPRTSAEVAEALAARGVGADDVESVLGRLKSHRHLDDAVLAGDDAFSLVDGKGLAPAAAVQKLLGRGIPEAVARDAVEAAREGRTESELCARALERRTKGRPLAPDAVGKEGRALARLGYDEETVLRALERALANGGEQR